jgi:hypothetical protein
MSQSRVFLSGSQIARSSAQYLDFLWLDSCKYTGVVLGLSKFLKAGLRALLRKL